MHSLKISDKLVCPRCKSNVTISANTISCDNSKCGTKYPIIDGIPILINNDNSVFNTSDYKLKVSEIDQSNVGFKSKLRQLRSLLPDLSNNLSSKKNFRTIQAELEKVSEPRILVIGGATITSDTEMIMNSKSIIVESDVAFGPRTQVIFDAHDIPFKDETFDLVIYQAVLEHVADPQRCAEEAYRVLNKDGIVFAATPFMQQVHLKAYDFTRFTYLGHRRLFRKFKEIDSGIFAGTGVTLGWSIKYFFFSFIGNKYLRHSVELLLSILFFWLKYVDFLTYRFKGSYDGASGFYFIGRKSEEILSDRELIKQFKGNS